MWKTTSENNYYIQMKEKTMTQEKKIPVLFARKEECCGCTACYAICPKGAIKMQEDEEGFEYPYINEEICVRCGMCLKVCPIKEAKSYDILNPK